MYIADFAESAPDRAAVVMGASGRRISYRELNEASIRFARVLHDCGLRRGDSASMARSYSAPGREI